MIKNNNTMISNIKKISSGLIAMMAPFLLFGEEAAQAAAPSKSFSFDINMVLALIAIVLLLPLYFSMKTFFLTARDYVIKSNTDKKIGVILLFMFFSQFSFAQTVAQDSSETVSSNWSTIILLILIAFEVFFIIFFAYQSFKFIKGNTAYAASGSAQKSWFQTFWDKINSFKPLEEEGKIDTGHSYDGIRELDNITPPWFTTSFLLTILFAGIYLYRYHVAKSAPLMIEEYKIAMADAEKEKVKNLAKQGNLVDENTVKMLSAADIEAGKGIFVNKCAPCHAATGGSMPGGVGPNLTDDFWIHGGSLKDVFKSLKYKKKKKGMISWKDQLSANQIAQVSSFIKSIHGSNPPGAKEPQGEKYDESKDAAATTTEAPKTDSVTVKK